MSQLNEKSQLESKRILIGIPEAEGKITIQFSEVPSIDEFKSGLLRVFTFLSLKFFENKDVLKSIEQDLKFGGVQEFHLELESTEDEGIETAISYESDFLSDEHH